MADIEKVIKGLECCCKLVNGMDCNNCQYGEECNDPDALECVSSLTYDALELLKELKPDIKRKTKAVMTRGKAREILNILPRCKECDGTFPYNCDECDDAFLMAFNALGQPEIIRCKDCRYWQDKWEQDKFSEENHTTMPCIEMATTELFYCGFGTPKEKPETH